MSSYRQILYHVIFETKNRGKTINPKFKRELYKYIWGIIKNRRCVLYQINGVSDHIHILTDLHPSIALADLIKDIKVASSLWMKASGMFPDFIGWSQGYGAFTYAYRNKKIITNYIKNQEQHHLKISSKEEFIAFLKEHGLNYDDRFL